MKDKYSIMIGRDYGSGGLEIAEKVAARLGIGYFNIDLVDLVSEINEMNASAVQAVDKNLPEFLTVEGEEETILNIYEDQSALMKSRSSHGSAIFLGRCADGKLKHADHLLSVFITAPLEFRAERIKKELHLSDLETAKERVKQVDKERKCYYEHYSGNQWGDVNHKDFVINSQAMGINGAVELIVNEAYRRWGRA